MNSRLMIAAFGAALMSLSSFGGSTYTWTGNGSAGLWNDPANWTVGGVEATTIPGSDDTAVFPTGGTYTITDDITSGTDGKRVDIQALGTAVVNLNGTLTGAGGFGFWGQDNSHIWINRADNDYKGRTYHYQSNLHIISIANVGAGNVSSFGAPETPENGDLYQSRYRSISFTGASGYTTLSTDRTANNGLYVQGPVTLTWNGTVSGPISVRGNCAFHLASAYTGTESRGIWQTEYGNFYLDNDGNTFVGNVSFNQGTIHVPTVASFGSPTADNTLTLGQRTGTGTFRYYGSTDFEIPMKLKISAAGKLQNDTTGTKIIFTNTGTDAVMTDDLTKDSALYFVGVGDGEIAGAIPSNFTIYKRDGGSTGTWTLKGNSTSKNDVTLSVGRLNLDGEWTPADSATPTINVTQSGTRLGGKGTLHEAVSIGAKSWLEPGHADEVGTLTIQDATLTLAGNSTLSFNVSSASSYSKVVAGAVTVGGTVYVHVNALSGGTIEGGTYTLMTYTSVSAKTFALDTTGLPAGAALVVGDTALTLKVPRTIVWEGDGTANSWDKSTANWTGTTFVDEDSVQFTDAGSNNPAVTTAVAVAPSNVTVNATQDYTINAAQAINATGAFRKEGEGALTLQGTQKYKLGATILGTGAVTLDAALQDTSLVVSNLGSFVQTEKSVISGSNLALTFYNRTNTLNGANTFTGNVTWNPLEQNKELTSASYFFVADNKAFGNATRFTYHGMSDKNNTHIAFAKDGMCISGVEAYSFDGNGGRWGMSNLMKSGTATWAGDIKAWTRYGGESCYLTVDNSAAVLNIGNPEGGNVITGRLGNICARGGGTVHIYSRIVMESWSSGNYSGYAGVARMETGTLVLHAANNVYKALAPNQGTIRAAVAGAFCETAYLSLGRAENKSWCEIDLNGYNQTCAGVMDIDEQRIYPENKRVISTPTGKPATLTVNDTTDYEYGHGSASCYITGPLSITKTGTATWTLSSANKYTGTMSVNGGVLKVTEAGALAAGAADLAIAGGKVQVDANQTVKRLFLGGQVQKKGTYGSSESAAEIKNDTYFSGTGVITVTKGKGIFVMFR